MNRFYKITFPTLLFCIHSFAQQNYFSQYAASPILVNPASTGKIDGTYRFIGQYKTQWANITSSFKTYQFAGDANLNNLNIVDKNLGIGMIMFNAQSGDNKFTNTNIQLSSAYHQALDITNKNTLSIGLKMGWVSNSIDIISLTFNNQINNNYDIDPTIASGENLSTTRASGFSISSGINWSYQGTVTREKPTANQYQLGLAINQVNTPTTSFIQSNQSGNLTLLIHSYNSIKASSAISIHPTFLLQYNNAFNEIIIGSDISYKAPTADINQLYFLGSRYRLGSTMILLTGIQLKSTKLAISYDWNTSSLNQVSNGNGGFEIVLIYNIIPVISPSRPLNY